MPKGDQAALRARTGQQRTAKQQAYTERQRQHTLALARATKAAKVVRPTSSWWTTAPREGWGQTVQAYRTRIRETETKEL